MESKSHRDCRIKFNPYLGRAIAFRGHQPTSNSHVHWMTRPLFEGHLQIYVKSTTQYFHCPGYALFERKGSQD